MNRLQQLVAQAEARTAPAAAAPPPPSPAANRLQERQEIVKKMPNYFENVEIQRIVNLPLVLPLTPEELEEYNRTHVMADQYEAGWRLFPVQADSMYGFETYGGLFGPIGVGWGKTLVDFATFGIAWNKGIQRGVLFVPANVLGQLVNTDIAFARSKIGISYPLHVLDSGKSLQTRKDLCRSKRRGLYIMPYSLLSAKDASDNLEAISPQILICDEAHNLAKASAARTKRVIAYITHHQPQLVIMSGTITKKSIKDFYHLIKPCLRDNCPLPLSETIANDWAAMIDAAASSADYTPPPAGTGPLVPLLEWARTHFGDDPGAQRFTSDVFGFRRAFQERLNSAPGVVTSGDSSIGTSLVICNKPVENYENCEGYKKLDFLVEQVQDLMVTPNGDEIEHAIHAYKWLNELCGAGFYNELTWPEDAVYAERKKITEAQAKDILERAKDHHKAGQRYAKCLRTWLKEKARPRMDTPFLIAGDMARNGATNVGVELYKLWKEHKDLDFEGRPDRDSHAVRICPFKINAAVQWCLEHINGHPDEGAIVWVDHIEVGLWLTEALKSAGINPLHCPAGERFNLLILDPKSGNRIVVASYNAHGTGKNLQHFQHQYFLEWPRSAAMAEQTLGRTHRNGQMADELIVYTNQTLVFDQMCFAACLNDALYTHQTTGNRQKLIYAVYAEPRPKIFPPSILRQQGIDAIMLTAEQRRAMVERFGNYEKDQTNETIPGA
jgi:hypothetical protein